MAEHPDGSRRPVWDPGEPGTSGLSQHRSRDYSDADASEPSSSMPASSSASTYSALSSVPIYRPHSYAGSGSRREHQYPDSYEISGSQSGMYQPTQSSYAGQRSASPVDAYHGVSSVNEAYPALQAAGDSGYVTGQAQAVGSSGISQSTSGGQPYMQLHVGTLQQYAQSEVSTSGGTPPPGVMMPGQSHGPSEAEILNRPEEMDPRRGDHRSMDMEPAVSSISGSVPEESRKRVRIQSKSSQLAQMQEVMSGEPDTTQDSDDELQDFEATARRSFIGNTSSLDDSEAIQSSVAVSTSMHLPSTSNGVDSVMENEQLSTRQIVRMPFGHQLSRRMGSEHHLTNQMTSSQHPTNQQTPSSSSQFPPNEISRYQNTATLNQFSSSQQASNQVSGKHFIDDRMKASQFAANHVTMTPQSSANQLTEQITESIQSQFGNVLSSSNGVGSKYPEFDSSAADSSAVVDHSASLAMSGCDYLLKDEQLLHSTLDDGMEPGPSFVQSSQHGTRKSSRLATMENEIAPWQRRAYTAKAYNPNSLWCEECMTTYEEQCPTHKLQPVADKIVFSRAWASLPPSLTIFRFDTSEKVELGVFAKRTIPRLTQFGPFVADLVDSQDKLPNDNKLPLMVERSSDEVMYYNASDENKCNWMMFVRPATTFAEQNMVVYQHGQDIYFSVTRAIEIKAELKVWYAHHYGARLGQEQLLITEEDITAMEAMACKFQCYECNKRFRTAGARQKHLAVHDDGEMRPHSNTVMVAATTTSTSDDETSENGKKKRLLTSQNMIRKKIQAAKKIKDMTLTDSPGSAGIYHWKKRSTNIYLNKTLKKYQRRQESEAMRKSVQSLYRKTGKEAGGNEWICNTCDLTFDNSNLLNLHTLTHAAEDVGLDEIRKFMLEDPNLQIMSPQNSSQDSGIVSFGEYTFACPVCHMHFAHKQELIEHAAEHGKSKSEINLGKSHKCDKCGKSFATPERLQRHFLVHGEDETKPLQCQVCYKRFMNNSALACHMKIHSSDKYYECPICRQGFDSAAAMREHSFIHANPDGLFKCPSCEKQFAEFLVLKKHIRGFHTNKTYFCPDCDKVFPRMDKLRLHMLRHSNHREFMCDTCGRQFKRKDKLKEHIKRMHSIERVLKDLQRSERPLMKKFTPKVSPFDYHRFIYKCHLCLLGFKRRGMLVNHLAKRHPDVTPDSVPELNLPILKTQRDYYCQYCNKIYKSSSKRKSHILKNHPGAEVPPNARKKLPVEELEGIANPTYSQTVGSITTMPQQCEYCHKQYASKAKLTQHQRKKHKELVPPLPERLKRETIQQQMQQDAQDGTMIQVVQRYDADGQPDSAQNADLLTQAMSELSQSLHEYRPGMPEGTYQVQARVGNGPPTMVQIQPAGSNAASTIELSQLNQAIVQHFGPSQGHVPIQVAIATTGAQPIQIPVVTSQPGATSIESNAQIVTVEPIDQSPDSPPAAGSQVQGQAVAFPPLNLVSGAYLAKNWTNYTYK